MRRLFLLLFTCSLLPLGIAQETEPVKTNTLYESVFVPDRPLSRRLEQADRLFEAGRESETAQLLGGILESANFPFLTPEQAEDDPVRTLHQTMNDDIIDRIRRMSHEARDAYSFQFEPTARRLLDNAAAAGSLDGIQQVARKYFLTASGASAAFLVGLSQFERGDYMAAFLTLDRLQRLHPAIPDALKPALDKTLAESQAHMQSVAGLPRRTAETAWLEQTGWRMPTGSPSQNTSTKASAPLLEKNWTVPVFNRYSWERETETLVRMIRSRDDVFIPASQPLVVGNLFITRTPGETIAVDADSGKRRWVAAESEYRNHDGNILTPQRPSSFTQNSRVALRLFFWHDRVSQQLSSDGERLFAIDEHDLSGNYQAAFGRGLPNLHGRGEDLRYAAGNTLTARDLKTGQLLWQAGKFPYVQKYVINILAPSPRNAPAGQVSVDETIFSDDEKVLMDTWFLGAPLPLQGRLYVIGETDGLFQLFVLESHTGSLIARQPFARVSDSFTAPDIRRTYPLFPSASEGIVICPTGNGLIAALDATTLTPIWCYSYAPAVKVTNPNDRNAAAALRNRQISLLHRATNEDIIRSLFAGSGWQVPSVIIDGKRILIAPPDSPTLFCLDLLTGELLWERTLSRSETLYVAGIHHDKVFFVTPGSMMTLDMNTGEDLTTDASRFPSTLKPAGVGVRSGEQYFIPFTDGHLAVADLNEGTLAWLDASGTAIVPMAEPEEREMASHDAVEQHSPDVPHLQREWRFEGRIEIGGGANGIVFAGQWGDAPIPGMPPGIPIQPGMLRNSAGSFASTMLSTTGMEDIFQQPIQFGNLVGIKGRFFSQSPMQISSFDQKEQLRQRAERLLQADAKDPEGLLQQGRILKSEGKLTEAVESFRASLLSKHTVEAAEALRKNLLEAMRKDYPAWEYAIEELESLAEFPDEWGMILHAQIEGVLQSGGREELAAVLEKVFDFGQDYSMLIPASGDHSAQLYRALACLIEQNISGTRNSALRATWEELAETFLQQLSTPSLSGYSGAPKQSFSWFRTSAYLPPEVQRWSMFTHIFRNTPAAERAREILREEYIRHRLPLALELQERIPPVHWSELPRPPVWKPKAELRVIPVSSAPTPQEGADSPPRSADQVEIDRIVTRLVAHAHNPGTARPGENPVPIPFLNPPDLNSSGLNPSGMEQMEFNYFIKPGTSGFYFCRSDLAGRELWQLALPPAIASGYHDVHAQSHNNRYNGEYATYIRGFRDFRLLVHGTVMIAFDTAPQSEKILWSKTLSSVPIAQQTSMRQNNPNQRPDHGMMPFPKNAVFVSPHAVCYWDKEANAVLGLDPMTGQTLWKRKILYENCTLLGDDDHLFLAFPDARLVAALDPANGRELESGTLPENGAFIYGTNIVFLQRHGNDYTLLISDLRDIHETRKRALQRSDSLSGNMVLPILTETLHSTVRGTSMLQSFRNDRFLTVATWDTKSLQIYDLQTQKRLLPAENTILDFVPPENIRATRCDVEIIGDKFLVLFTKGVQIRNSTAPIPDEEGTPVRRTYRAVHNVTGAPIDEGVMMLFDSEGNPCWQEPVHIEKWHRLLDVPQSLPVMLFAMGYEDTVAAPPQTRFSGIMLMGVDKRSGERLFRARLQADDIPMQPFRVSADMPTQEIIFSNLNVSPPRVVKAVFMEE